MPSWISKPALASQPPIQRKAYWDSLHQQIQRTSFLGFSAHFYPWALEQNTTRDMMQVASRTSPPLGLLKTSHQDSCTYTRNCRASTMLINFPLSPGNNFASLNTPCTGKNPPVSAISYHKVSGELYAAGLSEIKKIQLLTPLLRHLPSSLNWSDISFCIFLCLLSIELKGCSIRNLSPT